MKDISLCFRLEETRPRHKLTRLITQAQSYTLRVLYYTYNLRFFCFLGTTDQTSSAFVRKLSQVNEKPTIIIIISVCSQMITYKAVKANSWLQYWLPYLNIENGQTSNMIMMTVRVSSLKFLYSCRGYESMSALSSVSTSVLLVRVVLLRLIVLFCFVFFTIVLIGIRQTDNLFIQFASKKPILSW